MSGSTIVGSSSGSEFNPANPLQQKKDALEEQKKLKKGEKAEVKKKVQELSVRITTVAADSPSESFNDVIFTKRSHLLEQKTNLEREKTIIEESIHTISNILRQKNEDLAETFTLLANTLEQRTSEIAVLEKSIKNASENSIKNTSEFFGRLRNRFSRMSVNIEELQLEVTAKKESIESIRKQFKTLGVIGEEMETIRRLTGRAASLQEDINKCESDIKQAEEDLKIPEEYSEAQAKIQSLKSEIATIKKDIHLVETAQQKHEEISREITLVLPIVEQMVINTSGKDERQIFRLRAAKLLKLVSAGTNELHKMNKEHDENMQMQAKGAPKTSEFLAIEEQTQELRAPFSKIISNTTDHQSSIKPEINTLKEIYFALHPDADSVSLDQLAKVHGELREILALHLKQLSS